MSNRSDPKNLRSTPLPEGWGWEADGDGFYRPVNQATGNEYDIRGFDIVGFSREGIHERTQTLYDEAGKDRYGFYLGTWIAKLNIKTGTWLDPYGYDINGYDKDGFDLLGERADEQTPPAPSPHDD